MQHACCIAALCVDRLCSAYRIEPTRRSRVNCREDLTVRADGHAPRSHASGRPADASSRRPAIPDCRRKRGRFGRDAGRGADRTRPPRGRAHPARGTRAASGPASLPERRGARAATRRVRARIHGRPRPRRPVSRAVALPRARALRPHVRELLQPEAHRRDRTLRSHHAIAVRIPLARRADGRHARVRERGPAGRHRRARGERPAGAAAARDAEAIRARGRPQRRQAPRAARRERRG